MIGKITIECTASNPNVPLKEIVQFRHSASAIEITKVPDLVGKWKVIGMSLSMIYPDNRILTLSCTKVKDSWVCTIPSCNVVGSITKGYSIIAQIQDENGNVRNNFVIGIGDFKVIDVDYSITPEIEKNYMRYVTSLSAGFAGDFYVANNGNAKILKSDGNWQSITVDDSFLSSYVTKQEAATLSTDVINKSGIVRIW